MSTKNIKKSGKILHKIIGKNRALKTRFYTKIGDYSGMYRWAIDRLIGLRTVFKHLLGVVAIYKG